MVVDALVEEIQALLGGPLYVCIKSLENALTAKLDIQDEWHEAQSARLDTQHEAIRTRGARIEKRSEEIGSLRTEVRVLSAKIDSRGTKIDSRGTQLEKRGEEIGSLHAEIRGLHSDIDTQGTAILTEMRALHDELVEEIWSLQHHSRLILVLFVLLVGL